MHSFINIIALEQELTKPWYTDADRCYTELSHLDQGRFLVRQSIAINYLDRVYHNSLPLLFNQYKDRILSYIKNYRFRTEDMVSTESYISTVSTSAVDICEFFIGITKLPGLFSIDDIMYFLTDDEVYVPQIGPQQFYIPYVHFTTTISHTLDTFDPYLQLEHYDTIVDNAAILLLNWYNPRNVLLRPIHFISYDFNSKRLSNYYKSSYAGNSFLAYLSCMDLSQYKLKAIFGIIASFAVEFDDNVITTPANQLLKNIAIKLFKKYDYNVLKSRNPVQNGYGYRYLKFITYIRDTYNVLLEDKTFISNLFGNYLKSTTLKEYFNTLDINKISNEQYQAYKDSIFSKYKELDILVTSEAYGDDPEEEGDDPDDNPDNKVEKDEPTEKDGLLDTEAPSIEGILYREIVRKHINNILTNPEDKDPEVLAVLKNLKIYWLNLLSRSTIETILVMTNSPVN